MNNFVWGRRRFLAYSVAATAAASTYSCAKAPPRSGLDEFLLEAMDREHIPGLAAAIIKNKQLVWSNGYGWADIERRIPMTPDTVQNIGSVSKTFTATALMQLWEQGKFQLDDDVNDYLSFRVAHPADPGIAITFRLLITHRSGINDGTAYAKTYACGDPTISLESWLKAYLIPDGQYYNAKENFHEWMPGDGFGYCNVAYGLLGHLVEAIAGMPFGEYCRTHIFEPLEMPDTSWYLADIDPARYAVPYSWVSGGEIRGPSWGGVPLGVIGRSSAPPPKGEGYEANCLYNHPNFPDGFLRTSVHQLGNYLRAYLNNGLYGDARLLQEDTIGEMFTVQAREPRVQGLTWNAREGDGDELLWGHGGADPGINADVRMRFADGVGTIVLVNTNGVGIPEISARLLQESDLNRRSKSRR
jgi:CubicO group peptidase (beta-lactamase class C family)